MKTWISLHMLWKLFFYMYLCAESYAEVIVWGIFEIKQDNFSRKFSKKQCSISFSKIKRNLSHTTDKVQYNNHFLKVTTVDKQFLHNACMNTKKNALRYFLKLFPYRKLQPFTYSLNIHLIKHFNKYFAIFRNEINLCILEIFNLRY